MAKVPTSWTVAGFMTLTIGTGNALADDANISADTSFIARCAPPEGPTVEYGWLGGGGDREPVQSPDDGFQEDRNSFSNMEPTFIQQEGKSKVIYSVWGDTRPALVSEDVLKKFAEEKLEASTVVQRTEDYVSFVLTYPTEVWLTTLIPSLGVGYYSYHEIESKWSPGDRLLSMSSALKSECEFSRLDQ